MLIFWSAAQSRGGRLYMEDRHVWVQDLGTLAQRLSGITYASVLDGHGGTRCADFAARELHTRLAADDSLCMGSDSAAVAGCFRRCFDRVDKDFLEAANRERWGDGTTVLCALVHGTMLHVANCGDTRCVMGRLPEGGAAECEPVRLSKDVRRRPPPQGPRSTPDTVRARRGSTSPTCPRRGGSSRRAAAPCACCRAAGASCRPA